MIKCPSYFQMLIALCYVDVWRNMHRLLLAIHLIQLLYLGRNGGFTLGGYPRTCQRAFSKAALSLRHSDGGQSLRPALALKLPHPNRSFPRLGVVACKKADKGDVMDDEAVDDSEKFDVEKMDLTGVVPLDRVYLEAYNEDELDDFCMDLLKLGYSLHEKGRFFSALVSKKDDEGDNSQTQTNVFEKIEATGAVTQIGVYIDAYDEDGLVALCKVLDKLGYSLRLKTMFSGDLGSKEDDDEGDDSQKKIVVACKKDDKGDGMDDEAVDGSEKTDVEMMDVTGVVPLNRVHLEAYNEDGLDDLSMDLLKLGYLLPEKGRFFSALVSKKDDEGDNSQQTNVFEKMEVTGAVPQNGVYIVAYDEEGLVALCKKLDKLGYSLRLKTVFFGVLGSKQNDDEGDHSQKTIVLEKERAVSQKGVYIDAENREGLVDFCKELHKLGFLLHAKGKTAQFLRERGLTAFLTSEILSFEEFLKPGLDVKENPEDAIYFKISGMSDFSVFVVNRWSRFKLVGRTETDRQAGKLYDRLVKSALGAGKAVIVDPSDYSGVLKELKNSEHGRELYPSFNEAFFLVLQMKAVGSLGS